MINKIGYAAGSTDGGEWLTVWGSAYAALDLLFPTRESAERRAADLRANTVPAHQHRIIVRKVEYAGGGAFRIIGD